MEIRTKRLILREFTLADIPAVEAYHAHPDYSRFLPWEGDGQSNAEEFVKKCIARAADQKRLLYQFAITLPTGEIVGSTGLKLNPNHPYEAHFACELNPTQWGRGFGTESCRSLIEFGFGQLDLHRIYSQVTAQNRAAVRMLMAAGMQREGLFRENRFFAGHWWDALSYGMLAREWKASREGESENPAG